MSDTNNWIIKVVEWITNDLDENPYAVIVEINDVIKYLPIDEYNRLLNTKK